MALQSWLASHSFIVPKILSLSWRCRLLMPSLERTCAGMKRLTPTERHDALHGR